MDENMKKWPQTKTRSHTGALTQNFLSKFCKNRSCSFLVIHIFGNCDPINFEKNLNIDVVYSLMLPNNIQG